MCVLSALNIAVKYEAQLDKLPFHHLLHKEVDDSKRGHTGIHVDYEAGDWNYQQFIAWLQTHIPEYALTYSELRVINPRNQFELTAKAARLIHDRDKEGIDKKGEIGELILHGLIRDIYQTEPLISKIYYKSHASDNVKGFDCVHIIFDPEINEISSLWLGEAKFHGDAGRAIKRAFESVSGFLEAKKMRHEFMLIRNHLDDVHPAKHRAEELLAETTSLDQIKAKICVPVLITYESGSMKAHSRICDDFLYDIEAEMRANIQKFLEQFSSVDTDVDIHVFFFPLKDKVKTLKIFKDHIDNHQGARELY